MFGTMKWNKLPAALGSCLLPALMVLGSGDVQARIYDDVVDSGFVRIGVYRDFPPYSFEQDGKPAGIDVDLGEAIAEELGVSMRVHWMTPDETLDDDLRNNVWKGHYLDKDEDNPLAMKNVADVMMRVPYDRDYSMKRDDVGLIVNDLVVMMSPYHQERWQLAFDSEKLDSVRTLAKFQYNPIGVEVDSLPAFYMTSALQGRMREKTHHYTNPRVAFAAMKEGEVSAVMAMRSEIDWLVSNDHSDRYRLAENGFPDMGKQAWDIGIAVGEADRDLGYAVETLFDRMIRDGSMAELFARYGVTYESPSLYLDTP
ncbi:amino acid ABC transporter substrate-binding protein, PAAT family [Marinobacterium lutimaris]|uniref:Amino acid ABC transporter substrate-binding protein, PAAT family n=2 Tax=Marinobacterium lutimaris TaxID=568106 RepID=A0A1H5W607_9GAMM|nr:amino acid ABC transporter substrate-binding protein, PAAT family [Marinobacterium lutimaris]